MKTVFSPSDMVGHVWSQQNQPYGRNSRGNFYFDGATIYSYGRHFPIARIVKYKGKPCVLFTTRDYSSTTAGHKSDVRRALGGGNGPIFYVADPTKINHKANLKRFRETQIELAKRLKRARSNKEWLSNQLTGQVDNANRYAEFFGLKTRFDVPDEQSIIAAVEAERRKNQAENARKKKAAEIAKAERAKRMAAWIAGEPNYFRTNFDEDVLLRVKGPDDGQVLETSLGAEVPLKHAVKILPIIRSGKPYERNGHTIHLGHFALDKIDEQGNVKAGCHTIKREEIERIASLLKL